MCSLVLGALLRNQTFLLSSKFAQFVYRFILFFKFKLENKYSKLLLFCSPDIHYAYSFRNHLSLTSDMSIFKDAIREVKTGGNYDDPEAGLDALMQVMACDKELGWRPDARRIIVLFTDATYHSAGDGKMVGAEMPNDMDCHLNSSKFYDHSLILDYPSVSQINKMATDGNFIIIFAALHNVEEEYVALASQITGAKYTKLKTESNILDIIKSAYLVSFYYNFDILTFIIPTTNRITDVMRLFVPTSLQIRMRIG